MLGQIRKFSSSFFAKVLLGIIIIPFVFWGMGPLFQGGNLNTIIEIDKKKISTQEFVNYVENYTPVEQTLNTNLIDKLLSNFIGEKLITQEIEDYGIQLSDLSLSKIIKNEKLFKKGNEFSRVEYEKFLVENGLSAVTLEANISKQNKKEQLFDFIGGGIVPSKFLVNNFYNSINQKRNVELINLNEVYKNKIEFSEKQIKEYFEKNKSKFENIYRSVKFIELSPKNLTQGDEFNDSYFEKIDEIDDLIVVGENLNFILNKFNLESPKLTTLNKLNNKDNLKDSNVFSTKTINKIFEIDGLESTILVEQKNKFFIIQLTETENIKTKITDPTIKNEILKALEQKTKVKLFSEIAAKINEEKFTKENFDQLSIDEDVTIKKIVLQNQNDDKILKKELVKQIYSFAPNKVAAVADIGMSESYLIYINKIENVSVKQNSDKYDKYFNLSKANITSSLYNTYDSYLRKKYNIEINYKALNNIKNNLK